MTVVSSRDLVSKALTDPSFRRLLETQPARALGLTTLSAEQTVEITKALTTLRQVKTPRASDFGRNQQCGIASQ